MTHSVVSSRSAASEKRSVPLMVRPLSAVEDDFLAGVDHDLVACDG
jgi:hypothetical protein